MKTLVLAPFQSEWLATLKEHTQVFYEPWTETRKLWPPHELFLRLKSQGISIVLTEANFLVDDVFQEGTPL